VTGSASAATALTATGSTEAETLTTTNLAPMASRSGIRCALSIAGSDSGGGAGIQADLKAFAACGVHGTTAITAITAQNTLGVTAIHSIPPEIVIAQVRAVQEDIGIDAVKIGMLGTTETIQAVAQAIGELPAETPVVLDPVMMSESGAELLEPNAVGALVELLLPRATVVTPNLPEARLLAARSDGRMSATALDSPEGHEADGNGGHPADPDTADAETLARTIHALGPRAVVITGGHREVATDVFFDGSRVVELEGERFRDGAGHGSGCTHSSALAARLARGDGLLEAARRAKAIASGAVRDGLREIGSGAGPVDALGLTRRA
jgi:hydroxymethylpyrimidine/phosphomethylpyrimidine kinase